MFLPHGDNSGRHSYHNLLPDMHLHVPILHVPILHVTMCHDNRLVYDVREVNGNIVKLCQIYNMIPGTCFLHQNVVR